MGEMVFFSHFTEKDTQSVGLVFEPDSFICYLFAGLDGESPIGLKHLDSSTAQTSEILKSTEPVFGIIFTKEYTLLPPAVFSESEMDSYLQFATPVADSSQVAFERLFRSETVLLYRDDAQAQSIAAQIHPGLQLRHAAGVLIETLHEIQAEVGHDSIYLHQAGEFYTTIVYRNKQLLLVSSNIYKYIDDVRYYVLYCRKILGLNTNTPLHLLGEAAASATCRQAFENVISEVIAGLPPNKSIVYPPEIDNLTMAVHIIPLSAARCV